MKRILLLAASLILAACAQTPSAPAPAVPAHPAEELSRQIYWQRSLEDALALCKSTGRPLLVAMNMDGESASERITKENYRDPKFVALTRSFVCVIGSVFRHNLRDHDEQGRRIPCPRLGEVTCGEHIALEPILFDKYLGGERIAPRHALILSDGTKKFDEFLLYDLRDLYRIFAAAPPNGDPTPVGPDGLDLHRPRLRLEDELALAPHPDLARLRREGGAGSLEALLRLSTRPELALELADTARALSLGPAYANFLEQRLEKSDLAALARLDDSKAGRTLQRAAQALEGNPDGPWALADVLERSQKLVGTAPISDERAPADLAALERELAEADEQLQKDSQSLEARARFGRVSLALARARIEAGFTRDVQLMLTDADHWLGKAAELAPKDVALALALERAEASYRLANFVAEEQHALEAFELSGAATATDPSREQREALRWVGDAAARNCLARSGGDEGVETAAIRRGALALQRIALTAAAGESDWQALASFHGMLGLTRHEREYLAAGVMRLPASQALRAALTDACWRAGDLEFLTHVAEQTATLYESSADAQWYLGIAWIQRAEWARRGERVEDAIREYQGAERAFERCAELKPEFAGNCTQQRANCRLGIGFAHLLVDERASAAQSLVEALKLAPAIAGTRDGLDREPIDLLDQSLEWRASGPSPVDAMKLLGDLEAAAPQNPFWPRALSDSELREARRAQHRDAPGEAIVYCQIAISAARHARELADDEDNKRALLLPLSLQAELFLAKDELAPARAPLLEVAKELGMQAPAEPDLGFAKQLLAKAREKLGEAAPVNRPGR